LPVLGRLLGRLQTAAIRHLARRRADSLAESERKRQLSVCVE
jgi:hypothetical protein